MSTDFDQLIGMDEIIAEVAKSNHHAVSPDDPVMVLVTIINMLGRKSSQLQSTLLDDFRAAQDDAALRFRKDAIAAANRILNAASDGGKEVIRVSMYEVATQTVNMLKEETERCLAAIRREKTLAKRSNKVLLLCSAASMTGGVLALLAALIR